MKKAIIDFVTTSVIGGIGLFCVMFTYLHILEYFGI
jgi:hypothetical protein